MNDSIRIKINIDCQIELLNIYAVRIHYWQNYVFQIQELKNNTIALLNI